MLHRLCSKENLLVLAIQAVLCLIAFNKFFVHPLDTMFMNMYDGIKNYFTFQSYLQQDPNLGLALVKGHAYPFGDYLFYADLTPVIAVPLRFFSVYVYDISDYGIPIFNFIIILLHWITALVAYRLTKHFVQTPWLAVIIAIAFTWINPQIQRLGNGHFNLSISLFILLVLLFLIHIYKEYHKRPENYFTTNKGVLVALVGTLYIASFTHLYFLPILGVTIGFSVAFYSLELRLVQKQSWANSLRPLWVLSSVTIVSLVLVMGTILLVDTYYSLRAAGNPGYGYAEWALSIPSLFTARDFNHTRYLFSSEKPAHYESNLYLGAFTLYSLSILILFKFFRKSLYLPSSTILSKKRFIYPLLAMATLCFLVAIGEKYYFFNNQYYFTNYLNPFFYLRKITSKVEQFRCLARFFWPSFWVIGLTTASYIDYYYRNKPNTWIKVMGLGLAILVILDTKDTIAFQNRTYGENVFAKDWSEQSYNELDNVTFEDYQSILPLPYFHTSSEVSGFILDGGAFYNRTAQWISLHSKLPMMSVQSSRLPVSHTKHLFSIFNAPHIDQELLEQLNEKPILVLYHKPFHEQMEQYSDFYTPKEESPARNVILNGKNLPQRYKMTKVSEGDTYIVYKWYPKQPL